MCILRSEGLQGWQEREFCAMVKRRTFYFTSNHIPSFSLHSLWPNIVLGYLHHRKSIGVKKTLISE
uniref:Uncharacterized protein n=1 Tax=Rhizophora mucronata TaxID=61149 RepID=A0A2P2LQI7_RHIMU